MPKFHSLALRLSSDNSIRLGLFIVSRLVPEMAEPKLKKFPKEGTLKDIKSWSFTYPPKQLDS